MLQFIVRRLIVALLVAATVMTLAFVLTRLSGDLAVSIAGPNATQEDIELVRKAYGLDRPLTTQFFDWVGRAVTGDLGESYFFKARVSSLIADGSFGNRSRTARTAQRWNVITGTPSTPSAGRTRLV